MKSFFEVLRPLARTFGPELARTAYHRGLAVTKADGTTRAIPITATPVVLSQDTLQQRVITSSRLASAGFKMAKAVLDGKTPELLLGAMSPLENALAQETFRDVSMLATSRVDYFLNLQGAARALELNATIPAMQGYSDIAAHSFIDVVGAHAGMTAEECLKLKQANGSNARALYDALQSGHILQRGKEAASIGILCRRNDAQITEVYYLRDCFRAFGTDTEVIYPDELTQGELVQARGKPIDLLYRHLFVRRLEEPGLPGTTVVADFFRQFKRQKTVLLNPPVSQAEIKTTFALLSMSVSDARWATAAKLTDDELAAVDEAIPWTRQLRKGATTGPDGSHLTDVVDFVAANASRFVLKRSWDYGGRAVFVGATLGQESFDERVRAAYGKTMTWAELCQTCAKDSVGGGFVVQELVESAPEAHVLCDGEQQREVSLYVDFSAYASVGITPTPSWGGVCRGSISRIVNIVGGGGVLPLLQQPVADTLLARINKKHQRDLDA